MSVKIANCGAELSCLVELTVAGRKLKSKDVLSKSDAVCVLFSQDLHAGKEVEVGRTESVMNSADPSWMKRFEVVYKFEEKQILVFRLYDWDKETADLKKQDLIGEVECTMAQLMAIKGTEVVKQLPKKGGSLVITAQELADCRDVASVVFSAEKLENKDTLGKSDPFLLLSKQNKDGSFSRVLKTAYIKNTLNPTWNPTKIPVRTLCNGKYDVPFKIECYDFDDNQKHDLIGECTLTLNDLKDGKPTPLINPKKLTKKKYVNSGTLLAQIKSIEQEKFFLDYLHGGVQLHFFVAVDFTASNGPHKEESSLHYLAPGGDNAYTTAIKAVGRVVDDYNKDHQYPAIGFGARVPPDNKVLHDFFMNGSSEDPYCKGVDGIIEAYKKSLDFVELFGPTNFAPAIRHTTHFASEYGGAGEHYFILLIITDGVISDMDETLDELIKASEEAVSVIIVGVGEEDFSAMRILDADEKRISHGGKEAARDIVQFVEFKKFQNQEGALLQSTLTNEVLKEIPEQLVSYMKKINK